MKISFYLIAVIFVTIFVYFFVGCKETEPNTAPVACFTCDGNSSCSQLAGLIIVMNPSCSYDRESSNYSLTCKWDWESDGDWDYSGNAVWEVSHAWKNPGTYTITMEVFDGELTGRITKEVIIGTPGW